MEINCLNITSLFSGFKRCYSSTGGGVCICIFL